MRRSFFFYLLILLAAGTAARAQVGPSAIGRQFSVTAGGIASVFQPDFVYDSWGCAPCQPSSTWYPVAKAGRQPLLGAGAYVDVVFSRWVQIEAEGRWLRFNRYVGVNQDNYLIGPRVSLIHAGRTTMYAKALGGYSTMNFGTGNGNGQFTALAFGGGLEMKMSQRISLRAADFEYQYWPAWGNSTLSPYGASMGIGYRIF
jgi:hypothetical protein